MNSWHSYPSIYNLGHRAIADLFTVPVYVEEKIDGSQFSFGIDENGELHARSKGAQLVIDAPEKMFARAIATVRELYPLLIPGWTYRAEYLQKPKHNALAYDRVPAGHLILFDVNTGEADYLGYADKKREADRLGLDTVPLLFSGIVENADHLRGLLATVSILGGQTIEGVVIKQQTPTLFGPDKKALIGKFVSEAFKEVHAIEWRKSNPTLGDIVQEIAVSLKTDARWNKAVQHLKETGVLQSSPRDIGPLLKEVNADVLKECDDYIRDKLFKFAWPRISRVITGGLPEWYKDKLLTKQFETDEAA